MPARIAYLSSRYPVLREAFIIREVLALERAGVEVTVFSLKKPHHDIGNSDLEETRAEVYWTPHVLNGRLIADNVATFVRSPVAYVSTALRNSWRVRAFPLQALKYLGLFPKMIHYGREVQRRGLCGVSACWANIPSVAADVARRFFELPYCMTCRAWDIHVPMNQVDLAARVETAAVLRTNNVSGAELMQQFCRTDDDVAKIHTVYNPFDVSRILPRETTPPGPAVLTAGGSLVEQKGLPYLLDALALLAQREIPVRVQLIGTGPDEAALRSQVDRLGLGDCVAFLGNLPNAQVLGTMKASHAFVLPCIFTRDGYVDGIPNVLIESLALGVPAVSTTISGIPELIEDGVSGLLVPQRDAESLADAIERLLADRALQEQFGRNGRAKVETMFDMSRNARKLIEIYEAAGLLTQ